MRKWIALLAVLMMTVLCAVSLAEEESAVNPDALRLYSSEWADGFTDVKIYAEEDHWRVRIMSADGSVEWDYCCGYNEAENTLVSLDADNIKTEIRIDEEGSEIERNDVYNDGKAVFSLNEEGRLIWNDEKENAGAGLAFEKIGWFQGVWISGEDLDSRYELYCYWDVEEPSEGEIFSGYKVEIERYEGEAYTHWVYSCFYNPENDTLQSLFGQKEYAEREGDAIVTVYDNGVAEFYFDDEGCIGWKDEIENAGEGLQFNATNG